MHPRDKPLWRPREVNPRHGRGLSFTAASQSPICAFLERKPTHCGARGCGYLIVLTPFGVGGRYGHKPTAAPERCSLFSNPVDPVLAIRPHVLAATARRVVGAFHGDVLYAVKCNDDPLVLAALWAGGVRHFDTASIGEVRRCAGAARTPMPLHAPGEEPRGDRRGLSRHGVRRFVLDHQDELEKIVQATGNARDLELFLRLAVPGEGAVLSLTGKFGWCRSRRRR